MPNVRDSCHFEQPKELEENTDLASAKNGKFLRARLRACA